MNNKYIASLLRRAAAAFETPGDLTKEELQHVVEDLLQAADNLAPEE